MRLLILGLLLALVRDAPAWEIRGRVGLEGRFFPKEGVEVKWHTNGSVYSRVEVFHDWNHGRDLFTFIPYVRVDEHDARRTHGDIRELSWIHVGDGWESRVGIRKVFWGVTEGRHLVDIINQTDLADQVDGGKKLGQPMINVSLTPRWGTLDFFVLPGFRERTYPGADGRPGFPIEVAEDAEYESSAGSKRVDFAARGQFFLGNLEVAVSHFLGTSRQPRLEVRDIRITSLELPLEYEATLVPVYDVIDQTGLELQWPQGAWLWKFEGITRSAQVERFEAATGGFEYTQGGLFGTNVDLSWILEYLWEEDHETLSRSPFEHDWLLGQRFRFNDTAGTEVFWALIHDPHSEGKVVNLEASRRLGSNFKISLEGRAFLDSGKPLTETQLLRRGMAGESVFGGQRLRPLADDDVVQAELVWYF